MPWKHGVLAKLYGFYFFHVRLENHFYSQRIPRAFVWRQSLELWQAFVYCGGISASGGLLSRLQLLWYLPELREGHRSEAASRDDTADMADDLRSGLITSFRREQGFGVITLDDGLNVQFDSSNCTMVPEEGAAVRLRIGTARRDGRIKALHVELPFVPALPPKQVLRLWKDRDIRVLRSIAQHAEFLATADEEAFLEYARREWCKQIDAWLQAGPPKDSNLDDAIARLLDETPALDAAINERLATLAELEGLGEEARRKARTKMR